MPVVIRCFIESDNYEDAIKLVLLFNRDTDTHAAILGSIAIAYYKEISEESYNK